MERLKKISEQGQVGLSETDLAWIGVKKGEYIVFKDEDKKHGRFISIFAPDSEKHKTLLEQKNGAAEPSNLG